MATGEAHGAEGDRAAERPARDATRRLLRVFGVTVTAYEERAEELAARAAALSPDASADLAAIVAEALERTAELDQRLREIQAHVLELEERVLGALVEALRRGAAAPGSSMAPEP